jgi:hypothetical protein
MELNRRQWLGGAAALGGCLALGDAFAAEGPVDIPLLEERDRFLVEVGVNAGRGYRFVLDTGATSHFISAAIVAQLKLPSVDARTVGSYGGRAVRDVVEMERFDVGGVPMGAARAIAWGVDALEGRDGLIGYPILQPRAVIDLAARRLRLGAAAPDEALLVPAEVTLSQTVLIGGLPGLEGRFVFDTGAQGCVISPAYYERVRASAAFREGLVVVTTDPQDRRRDLGFRAPALEFGPLTLRDANVRIADAQASQTMFGGVDGLFGAAYIRRFVWSLDRERRTLHVSRTRPSP